MKRLATTLLLAAGMPGLASAQVYYSSIFKPYYSRIVEKATEFPPGVPVEPTVTIPSPMGYGSATLVCTDSVKVPYDQEEAHITITSKYFRPVYVNVRFFRTVKLTWITERTVLIERDIGHIAGIEEILDVIDRRWLSQQSTSYGSDQVTAPSDKPFQQSDTGITPLAGLEPGLAPHHVMQGARRRNARNASSRSVAKAERARIGPVRAEA